MFGLTNAIPEIFSFNDQMFTTPPPPFLTVFIFIITSCAFEAVMTPFLHKYHSSLQHWRLMHSSICLIFSIEKISNFSRNSTTRLSVFVTSTSASPVQFVVISQTKSILGFGTAVKSILFQFLEDLMQNQWRAMVFYLIWLTGLIFSLDWLQGVFSFYHAMQNLLYQSLSL